MSGERSATRLELEGDAFVAAFSAWLYPADLEVRMAAVQSCVLIGVDYVETLARLMESTAASADTARYVAAASIMHRVAQLRTQGAIPRLDVLATGEPASGLGRNLSDDETEEV